MTVARGNATPEEVAAAVAALLAGRPRPAPSALAEWRRRRRAALRATGSCAR